MLGIATIRHGTVHTHHGAFFCLRLTGERGERLTRSDIASVSYSIYATTGRDDGTPVVGHSNVSIPIDDCILTSYRSWTIDSGGYNVRVAIPHTITEPFPTRGQRYRVEITITTNGGRHVLVPFLVTAL